MILDVFAQLEDSVALTTSAQSTNTYDLGAASKEIGAGESLCLVINVEVAALVVGTETYEFHVLQSANADLSSGDKLGSREFTTALATLWLTAGDIIIIPIPPGSITKRYIGMDYVSANSAGITISCHIQPMSMIQKWTAYADGITIS